MFQESLQTAKNDHYECNGWITKHIDMIQIKITLRKQSAFKLELKLTIQYKNRVLKDSDYSLI